MAERPTVALLGTGIMGTGMAHSLLRAGLELRVWNRTRDRAEALAADGAKVMSSPAEAVAGADVVVTMLTDGQATEDVARQMLPAAAGAVWAQMGTVGVRAIGRLAALAADAGVGFVDAPVSGTREPAEKGQLLVLASAPAPLRERVTPVFDAVGSRTMWVGEEPGVATRLKLILNHWLVACLGALAETIAFAEALGLDPNLFLDAIEGTAMGMPYARLKGTMMLERSYPPSFPVRLVRKDAELMFEAASDAGLDLRLVPVITELLDLAAAQGHADDDMAAVYEAVRPPG